MVRFKTLTIMLFLVLLTACRSYTTHVYSGVDPSVTLPSKEEAIFFALPNDASIREKQVAVLLKTELTKSGFNLVSDVAKSKWVVSFAVDRKTYTVGTSTNANAVGATVYGVPLAFGNSVTTNISQTDLSIYMQLYNVKDLEKTKPIALWEGNVTVENRVFNVLPNASIKTLLDKFGKNFDRPVKINKKYQKAANRGE